LYYKASEFSKLKSVTDLFRVPRVLIDIYIIFFYIIAIRYEYSIRVSDYPGNTYLLHCTLHNSSKVSFSSVTTVLSTVTRTILLRREQIQRISIVRSDAIVVFVLFPIPSYTSAHCRFSTSRKLSALNSNYGCVSSFRVSARVHTHTHRERERDDEKRVKINPSSL